MLRGETICSGGRVDIGTSEFKVMRSPAGWYVGTTYTDPEGGFTEPNSRETDYFETEEEANEALRAFRVKDPQTVDHPSVRR